MSVKTFIVAASIIVAVWFLVSLLLTSPTTKIQPPYPLCQEIATFQLQTNNKKTLERNFTFNTHYRLFFNRLIENLKNPAILFLFVLTIVVMSVADLIFVCAGIVLLGLVGYKIYLHNVNLITKLEIKSETVFVTLYRYDKQIVNAEFKTSEVTAKRIITSYSKRGPESKLMIKIGNKTYYQYAVSGWSDEIFKNVELLLNNK